MKKRFAIGIVACLLLILPFAAAGETANQGIDIRVNGVPLEEAVSTASEMFADAVEENVGNAIDGLNDVFDEFAKGFSESLDMIESTIQGTAFDYFCYSNSGSSTYEIYSYEVKKDEETGEWTTVCGMHCGYETYTLPADKELLNKLSEIIDVHALREWDGFNESDSMVMDGSGFSLEVDFADGSSIRAHGNNSFPGGFSEAKRAIDELFHAYLEKNGIEADE